MAADLDADSEALAWTLPKVVLHDHLDGSLRPRTLMELLHARGVPSPAGDEASLAAWFDARAQAGSLVEYLRGFALTVEAMASTAALARVAREAAEDARLDGGVALTVHAGEADDGRRVLEAVRLGARRIGHGVRFAELLGSAEGRDGVAELRARGVHFEVCPTSNVHTGAAPSIAAHPIVALWRAGISLSFQTDNRLMSRITHCGEAIALLQHTPLTIEDLLAMQLEAASHSFLPEADRHDARQALLAWAARNGCPLPPGMSAAVPP